MQKKCGLIVLITFLISCAARRDDLGTKNFTQEELPKELGSQLLLFDPEISSVSVEAAEVVAKNFGSGFKIPSFDMDYVQSDFVQILRCKSGIREQLEQRITEVVDKKRDDRKWVWYDIFGNTSNCKVASRRSSLASFQDISARKGSFFYIINPCISDGQSSTGREECSFRLSITNSIDYSGELSAAFVQKAAELSEAEAGYEEVMSQIRSLSLGVVKNRKECEEDYKSAAKDLKNSETWDALGSLLIATAAGVGARVFLGSGIKNFVSNPKLKSILETGGQHKNVIGGAFFSAAVGIQAIVRKFKEKGLEPGPACTEADQLAKELIKIRDQGDLDAAQDKLVQKSKEMAHLNSEFQGYNDDLFDLNEGVKSP